MKTISTKELKHRLDAGPVALFDVRGDVDYEIGHIPGAKTAPLGSLVFRVARVMNPGSFVVVYSGGDRGAMAQEAVERLEGLGMTNVHCYEEGLDGWTSQGLPVVASPYAKLIAQGPVIDCRPIVVDTDNAYGGAFKTTAEDDIIGGAGG
jgi:rhodanese-related sulfurtransferase